MSSLKETFNVIILTEVWIKSGEEDRYQIEGYNMLLQDRPDNQAGGVVMYLDSALHYTHCLILLPTAELINVVITLELDNVSFKLSLFGIYRQCKYSYNQFQDSFENILEQSIDPTVIIGDMNVCVLKGRNKGSVINYLNLISAYGFQNFIDAPTRIQGNYVSCIDHVLIRNSKMLQFNSSVVELGITDHYALNVCISGVKKLKNNNVFCKILDSDKLQRLLNETDWSGVVSCTEASNAIKKFYNKYTTCYDSSCTLLKLNSKNRKRKEWISVHLIVLTNRKNLLFKKVCQDRGNLRLREEYKTLSRFVNRCIRFEKLNYYSTLISNCQGDSKKYWNVVRKVLKKKKSSICNIKVSEQPLVVAGNERLIANHFNQYFVNVIPELKKNAFGCDLFLEKEFDVNVSLSKFVINEDDVCKTIHRMKNIKSVGFDGISIVTIKNNMNVFVPVLCSIFNKSLEHGIVPDEFKLAVVVPVFKAGDSLEVSSYRPISVISTIAKIFETIIKEKLLKFFIDNNIFSTNQFGFLPGRGTDLAIEKHITNITDSVNSHKYTLAVYLDFKKAFDMLDIDILVQKLKKYGIGGSALSWLSSFSRHRKQMVKIDGVVSNVLELQYGTAQGGVLGPILFLIYINDLLDVDLYSSIYAYADDTALVCSAYNKGSLKIKIERDLYKVSEWLVKNKLLINVAKTKCILFFDHYKLKPDLQQAFNLFCHSHQCLYSCACSSIELVESVKYLGLYVDSHLKWNVHVQYLSKKLNKINFSLYHLKQFFNSEHLRNLYLSWFENTIKYGIIHFGGTFPTILQPLELSQKHALRIIFNVRRRDRVSYLFIENNICTFSQLYELCLLLYIKKYINYFPVKQVSRLTRSANLSFLQAPNYFKEVCRRQLSYAGPTLFNKLVNRFGNGIYFEGKPKFKMKCMEFILDT